MNWISNKKHFGWFTAAPRLRGLLANVEMVSEDVGGKLVYYDFNQKIKQNPAQQISVVGCYIRSLSTVFQDRWRLFVIRNGLVTIVGPRTATYGHHRLVYHPSSEIRAVIRNQAPLEIRSTGEFAASWQCLYTRIPSENFSVRDRTPQVGHPSYSHDPSPHDFPPKCQKPSECDPLWVFGEALHLFA